MTQHIKYPEEVRMDNIERMVKIAEAQDEFARETFREYQVFEKELRVLVDEAINRMKTILTEAIYGA